MNGFNWGLPDNISTYGGKIDTMMGTLHVFMLALFVFWGGFYVLCIVKFRARPGHKATYEPIHATWSKWLEIGVAVFEAALLIGFSMPVWASFKREFPDPAKSTQVRIVAQQFAWNFWYPGPDGVFGKNALENISGGNPLGIDDADPNAKDDLVQTNNLYFPIDKPVSARISSKDVIHSFGVPALRIRQDAIPGMSIPIWFQASTEDLAKAEANAKSKMAAAQAELDEATKAAGATPTVQQTGAVAQAQARLNGLKQESEGGFDIACSQLCGNGHARMRAVLHAMEPAAYATWLKAQEDEKNPPPAETPAASPAASPAK